MPAHDRRRDFITDEVGEDAGMPVTEAHRTRDGGTDVARRLAVVEEANMLLPGNADQHLNIPLQCEIEQALWRHVVRADGVDARLSHQRQVLVDLRRAGERATHGIRVKGTIRETPQEKFSCTRPQKFPTDFDTRMFYCGGIPRRPYIIGTHRSSSSSTHPLHRPQ